MFYDGGFPVQSENIFIKEMNQFKVMSNACAGFHRALALRMRFTTGEAASVSVRKNHC